MSLKKTLRKLIGKRGTKRIYRAAPWMGLTLAVVGVSKTEKGREMLETAKEAAGNAVETVKEAASDAMGAQPQRRVEVGS